MQLMTLASEKELKFTHASFIKLCDVDSSSPLLLDTQTYDTRDTCLINSTIQLIAIMNAIHALYDITLKINKYLNCKVFSIVLIPFCFLYNLLKLF